MEVGEFALREARFREPSLGFMGIRFQISDHWNIDLFHIREFRFEFADFRPRSEEVGLEPFESVASVETAHLTLPLQRANHRPGESRA